MPGKDMNAYLTNDQTQQNELEQLPDQVLREVTAHRALYLSDPEKAHIWDPIVLGVPGGPIKNLLLTYTGRKSGNRLQTVLQYYTYFGLHAVVGSRGGTVGHPSWYLNLVAHPACEIQLGSFATPATARTADGVERAKWWPLVTTEQPQQLLYQSRTTREIPIVVFDLPK